MNVPRDFGRATDHHRLLWPGAMHADVVQLTPTHPGQAGGGRLRIVRERTTSSSILSAIATVIQGAPMAARRDETARSQRNPYIKDRERRKIERQHWRIRLLALAFITVSTAATVALVWVLIE